MPALAFAAIEKCSEYYLGEQGQSCTEVCEKKGLLCSPQIETEEGIELFERLGLGCKTNPGTDTWWEQDQPCYVNEASDVNYGLCVGFKSVPNTVECDDRHQVVRRLCHCKKPFFVLGEQGETCNTSCAQEGGTCRTDLYKALHGSVEKFFDMNIPCKPDYRFWWAHDQPCYVTLSTDPNYGRCLGFVNISTQVSCIGSHPAVRRLCYCF